ncbi:flagellar hook-associated protein FlgK [Actinoplanes sp. TBRC 11911]|uniref:flagellar hook-associated protein FlgK n=1 Tax=Actinoplanes sp. TBRC 11911 TaxID=2729386 RepID=UPI00145DB8B5|nr:flagellar hook-associated protein FlgK [Actinoplanes sp. TBRC 11911]NMO50203.1 flagellar hook-associated protein FlgK [Actinoplanes sp. TBRC 11911]
MGSTFGGINTALTSLYAQRRGLEVSGQNIANANTEGYTRQQITLEAKGASRNPGVYSTTDAVGAGVGVHSVERGRSVYLDERVRTEHANSAYLATQKTSYGAIEDVMAEPSDTAIQARMHEMWDSWNDVANNWQDPSTRAALIERSNTVAISLNDAHTSLSNQFDQVHNGMDTYVNKVNSLATSIADMNQQIVVAKQTGLEANELMDARDRQVMELSELAGASTSLKPNGSMNVFIGNAAVVSDFTARKVELTGPTTLDGISDTSKVMLTWRNPDGAATPGGTMGAMLDTLNGIIPDVAGKLDGVAQSLIKTVNDAVQTGFAADGSTNVTFFSGTGAKDVAVAVPTADKVPFSSADPTATPVPPATVASINNDVADTLAGIGAAGTGPDAQYQEMIGALGVASQAAGRRSEIQDSVTDQVDSDQASESGVNLDEEMTHLLTFQRGYEAASRVLTTIDSMLDQLINRTGLVGR